MKCYLAHPVTEYGGPRQAAAIAAIEAAGWEVLNPDHPYHEAMYRSVGMEYFLHLVGSCDALAFMRFPCGRVGAGVGKEILEAAMNHYPIYDVSSGALVQVEGVIADEIMTVEETREMIVALRDAA